MQQWSESMALDEPAAYSPRLVVRKPCRGKGTSGLLIVRSAEAEKVINDGGEYDDDGEQCSQGW
jgi:hypothetical protein